MSGSDPPCGNPLCQRPECAEDDFDALLDRAFPDDPGIQALTKMAMNREVTDEELASARAKLAQVSKELDEMFWQFLAEMDHDGGGHPRGAE